MLWLIADNPAAEANLRKEAARRGVDPSRLVFAQRVGLSEHLSRHRLADLFLDTLPYNAHTTACDALWMGLPLVTCAGQAFAGRVGASVLTGVGLPELVTTSLDDYEALGACPSSRCSSLSEFDSTLDYEQALPPLEYRSDVASAAECAGLRSQGPCLAVYRRAGAREPGFQGDRGQLREWARPAAVRSAHDGRVAAARLCEWALFVAADCQSLPRAERFR